MFPGNAYKFIDARIMHASVAAITKELDDDVDAVNFLSRFGSENYLMLCDAWFIDPRIGNVSHRICNTIQICVA